MRVPRSRSSPALIIACVAALMAGCTYYQAVPAAPSGPSTFDRAWSAALGAADDVGVSVSSADQTSGVITGTTATDDVTIRVFTQADGRVRVEFNVKGAPGRMPSWRTSCRPPTTGAWGGDCRGPPRGGRFSCAAPASGAGARIARPRGSSRTNLRAVRRVRRWHSCRRPKRSCVRVFLWLYVPAEIVANRKTIDSAFSGCSVLAGRFPAASSTKTRSLPRRRSRRRCDRVLRRGASGEDRVGRAGARPCDVTPTVADNR
jgi:hypothetical protein